MDSQRKSLAIKEKKKKLKALAQIYEHLIRINT